MKKTVELPIIPLRGAVVFPDAKLQFDVKRKKSLNALEYASNHENLLFVITQRDAAQEEIQLKKDVYDVGTIIKIQKVSKMPGNVLRVNVLGVRRGKIEKIINESSFYLGNVTYMTSDTEAFSLNETKAMKEIMDDLLTRYSKKHHRIRKEVFEEIRGIQEIGQLTDCMALHLIQSFENKQRILSEMDEDIRFQMLIKMLNNEIEIAGIQKDLHKRVKANIDKNQREYYLREQLKVIQNELGDAYDTHEEIHEYETRLNELNIGDIYKEKIGKEIKRLSRLNASSSEGSILRNYLDCVMDLPWDKSRPENTDLKHAETVLEKEHYGLEKVKERIIEYLAVRNAVGHSTGTILCLAGPPGTGKTSIAKSIASALDREYVRISLGGVRDEAEIRGHRRTYLGALPGRFVQALRYSKGNNPLILLDEIDKMSSDFKGDPAAALLEVLDSEQNHQFRDHFLDVPLDLSKVMFLATANSLRTIPRPLLDRLEILEIPSYTYNEKFHIAKEHLIPKQYELHGLKKSQVTIKDEAIEAIITHYTKEAGVRQLERQIGEICRKAIKRFLLDERKHLTISLSNITEYLGGYRYNYDKKGKKPQVGLARGLAWTEVGGDTLSIEVTVMHGKGKFQITGRIGDVMKESALAAMSYIRTRSKELDLPDDFYENKDVHIHIPEGAVPKDGPSAGITMALAMISAFTERPIREDLAMTGEITLRGQVLPIGGLKEKLLAAKRAGIFEVIVPDENRSKVDEFDDEVKEDMNIHYVERMDEVIDLALLEKEEKELV